MGLWKQISLAGEKAMPMALPTDIRPGGPHKGQELRNCSCFHQNSAPTLLQVWESLDYVLLHFMANDWPPDPEG